MALFYDILKAKLTKLANEGYYPEMDDYGNRQDMTSEVQADLAALEECKVLVADDAAKHWLSVLEPSDRGIEIQNAILTPPFEFTWVEYTVPQEMLAAARATVAEGRAKFVGTTFGFIIGCQESDSLDDPIRWKVLIKLYINNERNNHTIISPVRVTLFLDKDGRITKDGTGYEWAVVPQWKQGHESSLHYFACVFHVLSLLNLTHTTLIEHQQSRHVRRNWFFEYGIPPVIYKTLNIRVFEEICQKLKNPTTGKVPIELAWHDCRGHFRIYLPDRPLFGKVAGRFWFRAHTRGNPAKGIIHKRYEVEI